MSFENRYSSLDRLLHRLAFSSPSMQIAVADIEDRVFATDLEPIEIERPVFVTALPRAGTTLLLEAIESLPDFASHTYQNMPFVLCPMLWNQFSTRFRRPGDLQERAHQDGMLVSTNSPEAFEEIIWKAFWKHHYEDDRVRPWADNDTEFFDFLRNHMRKIIALSWQEMDLTKRYLSKNNLNIARTALLKKNFPDAIIIVPFREPLQHAASLLRQHKNFLKIHRDDPFSRQYMAGIGHYDFGENVGPIEFSNWLDQASIRDTSSIGFWLEYWFETYRHLADRKEIHLVCFEQLCEAPFESLTRLCDILQPSDRSALLNVASRIRTPQPHPATTEPGLKGLLEKSQDLYEQLRGSVGRNSSE